MLSAFPTNSLFAELQRCFAPNKIIHKGGRYAYPDLDLYGIISSLILVRLLMFNQRHENEEHENS